MPPEPPELLPPPPAANEPVAQVTAAPPPPPLELPPPDPVPVEANAGATSKPKLGMANPTTTMVRTSLLRICPPCPCLCPLTAVQSPDTTELPGKLSRDLNLSRALRSLEGSALRDPRPATPVGRLLTGVATEPRWCRHRRRPRLPLTPGRPALVRPVPAGCTRGYRTLCCPGHRQAWTWPAGTATGEDVTHLHQRMELGQLSTPPYRPCRHPMPA